MFIMLVMQLLHIFLLSLLTNIHQGMLFFLISHGEEGYIDDTEGDKRVRREKKVENPWSNMSCSSIKLIPNFLCPCHDQWLPTFIPLCRRRHTPSSICPLWQDQNHFINPPCHPFWYFPGANKSWDFSPPTRICLNSSHASPALVVPLQQLIPSALAHSTSPLLILFNSWFLSFPAVPFSISTSPCQFWLRTASYLVN